MSTVQENAQELASAVSSLRREAAKLEAVHAENLKREAEAQLEARRATSAREAGERELVAAWEKETAGTIAWNVARERERTEELARRARVLPALVGTKGGAS